MTSDQIREIEEKLTIIDATVEDHGSILVIQPKTMDAQDWIRDHVDLSQAQWWCGGLAAERNYADAVVEGMIADGLEVAR